MLPHRKRAGDTLEPAIDPRGLVPRSKLVEVEALGSCYAVSCRNIEVALEPFQALVDSRRATNRNQTECDTYWGSKLLRRGPKTEIDQRTGGTVRPLW